MWRTLFYLAVLGVIFALAFYLPKIAQQSEGFNPLAKSMVEHIATAPPASPETKPAPEVEVPAPMVAAAEPETPAPTPVVVEAPPPAPEPPRPAEPDLTPFVDAMAAGDLPKAAALLELMKAILSPAKYTALSANVTTARKREAELAAKAEAAAKVAAPAPAPVDPAAAQSQAAVLESLRLLQQSQQETAKMLAQLQDKQKVAAAAPPAKKSPPPDTSGLIPGTIVVLFDLDSSQVNATEATKLQDALQALSSNAALRVEIRGFADKSGSSSYNLGLSRSRATAVQDIFRRAGIADSRINILPMGSFAAGASTTPEQTREMRRVEVLLVK